MTALYPVLHAMLDRWAFWGLTAQLAGAILIIYGFRLVPHSNAAYHIDGRVYPYLVLRGDRRWAYRIGWVLVVLGILFQMVPEVLTALRAAP
jgi:hypothetical protein